MKISNQHLSTYQKQQYTLYLETQLQKFSAFMLEQRKDNQKNKNLQENINSMKNNITQLTQRIKMLEFYQKQNFKQCQRIQQQNTKNIQFDYRLKKVQSMYFERPIQGRNKQNNPYILNNNYNKPNNIKQVQELGEYVQKSNKQFNKRIKNLQKQVQNLYSYNENNFKTIQIKQKHSKSRQNEPILTNYSEVNSQINSNYPSSTNLQSVTKGELKLTQNKIYNMFDEKFMKIEKMIRKSMRKQSKSPNKSLNSSKRISQRENSKQKIIDNKKNVNKNQTHNLIQNDFFNKNAQYMLTNSRNNDQIIQNSYSISDTSQRLKPVTQLDNSLMKQNKGQKKTKNTTSRTKLKQKSKTKSKSKPKSKSKQQKQNSQKISFIRSFKSGQHNKSSKHTPKKQNQAKSIAVSRSKSKSKSRKRTVSQSRSVSKSRSKQIKNKISPYQNQKSKNKNTKQCKLQSNKQYLMNCRKKHQ